MTAGRPVRESGARCGTCARGADDAVVDVGAAVDGDLQTVVGVVVLRRLVVGVELTGGGEERMSDGGQRGGKTSARPPHPG